MRWSSSSFSSFGGACGPDASRDATEEGGIGVGRVEGSRTVGRTEVERRKENDAASRDALPQNQRTRSDKIRNGRKKKRHSKELLKKLCLK